MQAQTPDDVGHTEVGRGGAGVGGGGEERGVRGVEKPQTPDDVGPTRCGEVVGKVWGRFGDGLGTVWGRDDRDDLGTGREVWQQGANSRSR